MKAKIPWQVKIAAKLVLSRVPASYRLWQRLGLFKLGAMEQPEYAYAVFKKHFDRAVFPRRTAGFVALELGPGDTLFSAMIAYAFGASASYLVDVGPFARDDLNLYQAMATYLLKMGLPVPEMANLGSLDELLAGCDAQYMIAGLSSLRTLPDQCVDFIWSQAVLQHIRKAEFLDTMRELRRVIRNDGMCSHRVDLKDHLGGALNNLRFSDRLWESDFMASSGFYTNRIRYSEMLQLFQQSGFDVEVIGVDRWASLPTPRAKLAADFRHLPDDELCVSGVDVLLSPA